MGHAGVDGDGKLIEINRGKRSAWMVYALAVRQPLCLNLFTLQISKVQVSEPFINLFIFMSNVFLVFAMAIST